MRTSSLMTVERELQSLWGQGTIAGLSDAQLLERFAPHRDEGAFEILVHRHGPMVLAICRRILGNSHDAEDAFQATFLVLARKAGSIARKEMLAGWLYAVARQTARKARALNARKQMREKRMARKHEPETPPRDRQDDQLQLLEEELERLPDFYRLPIVLCELEGKTHREAARQLGWPIGTVSGRLSRARTILAERLARRDRAPAGLPIVLTRGSAPSTLPSALVSATVEAAAALGTRTVATGVMSAQAAKLTEIMTRVLLLKKLTILVLGLVAGLGGGLTTFMALASSARPTAAQAGARPTGGRSMAETKGDPHQDQTKRALGFASKNVTSARDQPALSIVLSGVVVDPAGKPVADVEIVLAARIPTDGSFPALTRTLTDKDGAFRLEVSRQRVSAIGLIRFIWAYVPGRAVGFQPVELNGSRPVQPFRVTLDEPLKRTVTILDADDRPLAGVRLAPVLHTDLAAVRPILSLFGTPDDRLERMTVVTGADGLATIPYLPGGFDPLTVLVTAPGIAPHKLSVSRRPGTDTFTLKLARPARLTGNVSYDSGQPAGNVAIEVWVENTFEVGRGDRSIDKPSLIHFDSGPVRSRADGSFVTPRQLMTGSRYRVIVRPETGSLVSSEWLTATGELVNIPPFRLRQSRKLAGAVHDRGGEPVAGARVFLPSGTPSTTTDAQGRFLLEGVLPDRTYLLVQAKGFPLQGWPAVPARQPQERKLSLARTGEAPDRLMVPQPAPISAEESRTLARRALEPYLQIALEKGDESSRWKCILLLSYFDHARALELLDTQHFQRPDTDPSLRFRIAAELLATDRKKAESIITAIESPEQRARGYVWLAEELPAAEREGKRALLERAATVAALPAAVAERAADPLARLSWPARIGTRWLELGEVEKARPLLSEALKGFAALPKPGPYLPDVVASAARLDLDRALSVIQSRNDRLVRDYYVAIAQALASDRPAEMERVFQLIDDSSDRPVQTKSRLALSLCLPVAKTDAERAKRLIAVLKTPREQACGSALLALGLADRDKAGARSALAESIRLIDQLDGPPGPAERLGAVIANPAASILPIVEQLAPERLDELFWKAIALFPSIDAARERGVVDAQVADATIFLARYDRQAADVFLTQAIASESRGVVGNIRSVWPVIRAKAVADARGAVALFESLPPVAVAPGPGPLLNKLTDNALDDLITCLVEPIEEHWKDVWRTVGVPIDKPRFR